MFSPPEKITSLDFSLSSHINGQALPQVPASGAGSRQPQEAGGRGTDGASETRPALFPLSLQPTHLAAHSWHAGCEGHGQGRTEPWDVSRGAGVSHLETWLLISLGRVLGKGQRLFAAKSLQPCPVPPPPCVQHSQTCIPDGTLPVSTLGWQLLFPTGPGTGHLHRKCSSATGVLQNALKLMGGGVSTNPSGLSPLAAEIERSSPPF